jgi:flagellar hook-associated protein 2
VLTVTSERYGTESKVALTGGTALADLFGAPVSMDGADVAGSIGTFVTTGAGRVLTGGGLSLEVTGGATGDRGTVSYASGFAGRMKDLLDEVLETDGLIADRTEGIDRQIEGIDRQREAFNRRMETVEARYRAQFTALDTLIARMNSTSNFLTQQLAGLSASLKE